MKLFRKKKPEETVRDDVIDTAYIDKLLSGDRKIPVVAKREKPTTKPLPFMPFVAAFCFLLALISLLFSLYFKKALDAVRTDPTTPSTTVAGTTQSTTGSTQPTEKPTEPTQPTEPPLRFDLIQRGEITYLVPNKTLELSLRQYYCTSPSLPIPEDDAPAEDWLLLFYSMLTEPGSWYNRALTSHYASPDQIDMEAFLRQGIAQGASPLESYPEAQWLLQYGYFKPEDQVFRLPKSDINSLVGVYFGTTIEAHKMPYYRFNEQTGCYYFADKTVAGATVFGIVDFKWLEDGNVCVRYVTERWDKPILMQVTLCPVGDHFKIVSNLPAPTEPSTVELEDIPDMSGSVYEPGAMFAGEGYYGTAKWDAGDFSISLPLLEPFCEGAKAINAEIKSIYQPIIDDVKQNILYQTSSRYWKVSYTTYVGDDVLSIVISEHSMSDSVFYQVFNLDLSTGQQLDQYEMIRRYTGMSYPEFLLRANFTVANHLRKEYPMESEEVTNWLEKLETDAQILDGHKLILNEEGTLILLNDKIHSMAAGYLNVQIPFDPEACGEEFTDWELESYRWLFDIPADGAYSYHKGDVLEKTFFFDPERFLRYLSGSEYWLTNTAWLLASELRPENAPLIRDLCKQYLSRSDTAKAAQAILDQMEKYADIY